MPMSNNMKVIIREKNVINDISSEFVFILEVACIPTRMTILISPNRFPQSAILQNKSDEDGTLPNHNVRMYFMSIPMGIAITEYMAIHAFIQRLMLFCISAISPCA